jgi:hypothetical protein
LESGPHVRVRREWSTVVLVHERELYAMLRPIVIPLAWISTDENLPKTTPRRSGHCTS